MTHARRRDRDASRVERYRREQPSDPSGAPHRWPRPAHPPRARAPRPSISPPTDRGPPPFLRSSGPAPRPGHARCRPQASVTRWVSPRPPAVVARAGAGGDAASMDSPAPLLLTADAGLVADLRRLGAAAGTAVEVASPAGARPEWLRAPIVLVGSDALATLVASAPTRRERVHVVGMAPVPDAVFRDALTLGAESVLELPAAESWLVQSLADSADGPVAPAPVVGVVGGAGGVGASTFAAALAARAAHDAGDRAPVVLVDADRLGGGVERIVGLDPVDGTHWAGLAESAGRLGSRSLRDALPSQRGLAVLGWGAGARPRLEPALVREVLRAAQRGTALVVADLPRWSDPAATELLARCDHLVVVAGETVPAVAACAQVLGSATAVPHVHLVVRRSGTGAAPAEVASALDLPLRAVLGHQRGLDEAVGLGLGPLPSRRGPLPRAVRAVLRAIHETRAAPASTSRR